MDEVKEYYNKIKDTKYGWFDKDGNLHTNIQVRSFKNKYKMQSYKNIINSNHAICWEMCELERSFFKYKKITFKTVMAVIKNKNGNSPCHTFVIFTLNNKWYWFEASWSNQKGIHEFNNVKEIKEFFRNNFDDFAKHGYKKENLKFYEYKKPLFRYNCMQFYRNGYRGKEI